MALPAGQPGVARAFASHTEVCRFAQLSHFPITQPRDEHTPQGRKCSSRMSHGGCYGMTNSNWLISPRAALLLPGNPRLFKRAGSESMPQGSVSLMFTKIKETGRGGHRIPPRFFFFFFFFFFVVVVSRATRTQVHARSTFPQSFTGRLGVVCRPRRFAPRGWTSPYSPEMTGGTYNSLNLHNSSLGFGGKSGSG